MKNNNFPLFTVALNQTPMDWEGNLNRSTQALESIKKKYGSKPSLVLFPELSVSGYGIDDYFFSQGVLHQAKVYSQKLAQLATQILPDSAVFCGLPLAHNDKLYNSIACLYDGQIVGVHAKHQLANEGLHYEARYFKPWEFANSGTVDFLDHAIPIGNPAFEWMGLRIAIEICRDSWVADRPALFHQNNPVDVLLNPSASHFSFGKYDVRKKIVLESSRHFKCIFAQVNLLGNESGQTIFDGASLVASNGKIIHECRGFSFNDSIIHQIMIEPQTNKTNRLRSSASYSNLIKESYISQEDATIRLEHASHEVGFLHHTKHSTENKNDSHSIDSKVIWPGFKSKPVITGPRDNRLYNEFLLTQSLGLFDYLRKSHAKGFVVSLSGGADSATCALLVNRMVGLAVNEIGVESFLERIGRDDLLEKVLSESKLYNKDLENEVRNEQIFINLVKKITGFLLTTIYQSTKQSSQITKEAALEVAKEIGARHNELSVQSVVDDYTKQAQLALDRTLDWEHDDHTLQNIQARARSPLAWMVANANNFLLLSTGNRSEVSVGYCTMDGDTSGGLAPIAGVSKSFLRGFLVYMQEKGDRVCGPIASLQYINKQQPTAELRPSSHSEQQTDEGDLMPYDILNKIEGLAIQDLLSPLSIFEKLKGSELLDGFSNTDLINFITRFFTLWSRNQWKRERLAPGFHMDDYSLDSRGWARFPILSNAFEIELKELSKIQP